MGEDKEMKDSGTERVIDEGLLCPGPEVAADPYHAIMEVDSEGVATGQLWGSGHRLMLFESMVAAQKILEVLNKDGEAYALRGVSSRHLDALRDLCSDGNAELFLIVGFTPSGNVEAMPLSEYEEKRSKAGSPPPFPKKG